MTRGRISPAHRPRGSTPCRCRTKKSCRRRASAGDSPTPCPTPGTTTSSKSLSAASSAFATCIVDAGSTLRSSSPTVSDWYRGKCPKYALRAGRPGTGRWVGRVEFALGEMESNAQLVQIVPPNEVVVVIEFEIKLMNRGGRMRLCIPYNSIEPLVEDLSAQSWFVSGKSATESDAADRIAQGLSGARLELEATLATTTISIRELVARAADAQGPDGLYDALFRVGSRRAKSTPPRAL